MVKQRDESWEGFFASASSTLLVSKDKFSDEDVPNEKGEQDKDQVVDTSTTSEKNIPGEEVTI